MKTIINVNGRDILFWALCEVIGGEREKGIKLVRNAKRVENGYEFDIELKIDGIEFDFANIVNRLVESQNKIIEKAVKEELKDKFYDIINKSNEIIENLDYINIKVEENDK